MESTEKGCFGLFLLEMADFENLKDLRYEDGFISLVTAIQPGCCLQKNNFWTPITVSFAIK